MSYDIRRWTANARPPARRSRWTRWAVLVGLVAGLLLALAATFAPEPGAYPSPIIALVTILAASTSPFMRETWFTARGQAAFDEWERDALFRATTRAYALLLVALGVFLGWLWAASALGWTMPQRPVAWGSWLLFLLSAGLALPVAVAEFTLPLPTPDEVSAGEGDA